VIDPFVEQRTPRDCPTCGAEHVDCFMDQIAGMWLTATWEADRRLSEEGKEVRQMIAVAAETAGRVDEVWEMTAALDYLPGDDVETLKFYAARISLLLAAQNNLYEDDEE
jgi:hypothetical protein